MCVRYTGSPYHKRYLSAWGPAAYRADKTSCPPEIGEDQIIDVMPDQIHVAIREGNCSLERDGEWPRYVWGRTVFTADRVERAGSTHEEGDRVEIVWEARVANAGVPEYKAYPVTASRHCQMMPVTVRERLWPRG